MRTPRSRGRGVVAEEPVKHVFSDLLGTELEGRGNLLGLPCLPFLRLPRGIANELSRRLDSSWGWPPEGKAPRSSLPFAGPFLSTNSMPDSLISGAGSLREGGLVQPSMRWIWMMCVGAVGRSAPGVGDPRAASVGGARVHPCVPRHFESPVPGDFGTLHGGS